MTLRDTLHSSFALEDIGTMNDSLLTRRAWLARLATTTVGGMALTALLPHVGASAPKPTSITVYKDPSCGCCTKWVDHLRANGFAPEVHDRSDMDSLKDSLGVPAKLRSCHTAVVEKYVIEGHVPAADVRRLLSSKPAKTVVLSRQLPIHSQSLWQAWYRQLSLLLLS